MRTYIKNKNQLFIGLLIVGFFIGVLYSNTSLRDSLIITSIFQHNLLKGLGDMTFHMENYLLYILKERLLLAGGFLLLGGIKWKKPMVCIGLTVVGIMNGVLFWGAIVNLGPEGILFYTMGMFPQIIFYIAAAYMVLIHWFESPKRQWNGTKIIFVIVMFAVGIITETYVNPIIVKSIINLII